MLKVSFYVHRQAVGPVGLVKRVKACILRVGGTNCDSETKVALEDAGAEAVIMHMNKVAKEELWKYHVLVIPGGFSYGDYVRAGAIWAKRLIVKMGRELEEFVESGRLLLGICNGFQVLVEAGFLPGFEGRSEVPQSSLAVNESASFECRWVYLRSVNRGRCVFTRLIKEGAVLRMPVAHIEGRFILPKERERDYLEKMVSNDQLVFQYCDEEGNPANGRYPLNPNGSFFDIAGICNPQGNVMGLMPHPERAYFGWQLPDWTRLKEPPRYGDGALVFKSLVKYAESELT
ncbi:MAG: phosphoribosylformylglycinamidine synthase subunit PurQ [Candidatus Nezhaarchaeota archaeon]|nr:phosphoribosylformylglycinamidine synthase subunit PurQ [Candidatus Nezhaarchaeota archaeon]